MQVGQQRSYTLSSKTRTPTTKGVPQILNRDLFIDSAAMTVVQTLGGYKERSLEALLEALSRTYTSNNLLILDPRLLGLINHLTPFSTFKKKANFDQLLLLDSINGESGDVLDSFGGVIVLLDGYSASLNAFTTLVNTFLKQRKIKTTLVVKNLTRSFIYEINAALKGDLSFGHISETDVSTNASLVRLTPSIRLVNWNVGPLYLGNQLLSLDMPYGGLELYFTQPLEQISALGDVMVGLIENGIDSDGSKKRLLKVKNYYGKGDHSKLLISLLQNDKVPDFLNRKLNNHEKDFYLTKMRGNTDVVVLDRNLDFSSVFLNQLNYQGLIDDLFEINELLNLVTIGNNANFKLDDDLYGGSLKDLNFASIGVKLNKLAKYIQLKFQLKDNLTDLKEIRQLVSSLGDLTNKQELVKKHTQISESILDYIKLGSALPDTEPLQSKEKFNQYETFLNFQNDVFDLDYKEHMAQLASFIDQNFSKCILISTVVLISTVNNGIKEKDFENLQQELIKDFGIEAASVLGSLVDYKIVKLVASTGNDLFAGVLSGLTRGNNLYASEVRSPSAPPENPEEFENHHDLGITGGQDAFKSNYTLISKFWNLHPVVEEDVQGEDGSLYTEYPHPSFALPANTVPLLCRFVEALYFRDFLTYKPVNNVLKRPNWDGLGLDSMFHGLGVDINVCDTSDDKKRAYEGQDKQTEYVVVVILGGVTRGELSVFQYLQAKMEARGIDKKIVVVSSGIATSRKALGFFETL